MIETYGTQYPSKYYNSIQTKFSKINHIVHNNITSFSPILNQNESQIHMLGRSSRQVVIVNDLQDG